MYKQKATVIKVTEKSITLRDDFDETLVVLPYMVVGDPEWGSEAVLVKSGDSGQYRVFIVPDIALLEEEASDPDQSGVVFVGEIFYQQRTLKFA